MSPPRRIGVVAGEKPHEGPGSALGLHQILSLPIPDDDKSAMVSARMGEIQDAYDSDDVIDQVRNDFAFVRDLIGYYQNVAEVSMKKVDELAKELAATVQELAKSRQQQAKEKKGLIGADDARRLLATGQVLSPFSKRKP